MADENQIIIYGASDDCIEIEGAVSEEYNIYGDRTIGTVVLESPAGETLEVTLEFHSDWTITLPPIGEDFSSRVPWPVKLGDRPDRPEDPALFIDAPAGTTVKLK
jgi:hypothetical protein